MGAPARAAAERRAARLVALLTFLTLALAVLAVRGALISYGRPVAEVLVDANGVVSGISPVSPHELRFPEPVQELDGVPITSSASDRGNDWDRRVARAAAAGKTTVQATVGTPTGARQLELRIQPLPAVIWWSYSGALILVGLLYLAAGLIALRASPRGRLARSFAKLAVSIGFFVLTLFDLHTTRTLVPVFFAALAFVPGGFVLVALRLPDDAPVITRLPAIERVVDVVGLAVAILFVSLWATNRATTGVQAAWTSVMGLAQLFFVVTFVVRYARARGHRRAVLKSLFLPMVPPYLAAAGFGLLGRLGLWPDEINVVVFPAFALAPLACVYAFVRHDLWGSRALLTRALATGFAATVASAIAIAVGTVASTELGVPFRASLLSATVTTVLGAFLVVSVLRWTDRRMFPARAEYKPTIEQLSTELLSITSPMDVARAIERTVARWLPCNEILLHLDYGPPSPVRPLGRENATTTDAESNARLTIPVSFEGRNLATLFVGAKRGGALFTDDDLDLLNTIANQGALALAHAAAYEELDHRRRQQAAAWRGEREALVETVAAEIAHEIRYPLNFFRNAFERLSGAEALDEEDVDIGRQEVDRLERLVSGLRRMAVHRMDQKDIAVSEIWTRAEALLRDAIAGRKLEVNVPAEATLHCDSDQITQVVVNLVANALDAADKDGVIGVEWRTTESGAELSVWDSGPGFRGEPSNLFAPWYTTKPRGTGLGLAISQRLVSAHGWMISAARRDGRTFFTIAIPASESSARVA